MHRATTAAVPQSSSGGRHERTTLRSRPVSNDLHPAVYFALVGVASWFATAIWGFSGGGYIDWLLVVISGFVFIAVAIPVILSFVGYDGRQRKRQRFRDWASGDFATRTDSDGAATLRSKSCCSSPQQSG
jgi:hypothetical protein